MRARPVLFALLLAACSSGGSGSTAPVTRPAAGAEVSLRNLTGEPLIYLAVGEGSLALINPDGELQPGTYDDRLVPAGVTEPVSDILGYLPDLGVTFYFYRIDRTSGVARFAGRHLASAREIESGGGTVTVRRIDS